MIVLMSEKVFFESRVLSHESEVQVSVVHDVKLTNNSSSTVLMNPYVYALSLEAVLYSTCLITVG